MNVCVCVGVVSDDFSKDEGVAAAGLDNQTTKNFSVNCLLIITILIKNLIELSTFESGIQFVEGF